MPMPDPVIPFGKFKGQPCSEIPVNYLDWLIGQDWLSKGLARDICEHLTTRADWKNMEDYDAE